MARARFNDRRRNRRPQMDQLSKWEKGMSLDHFAGWALDFFTQDGLQVSLDVPEGEIRLQIFVEEGGNWALASCQEFGRGIAEAFERVARTGRAHNGFATIVLRLDLPDKNPREQLCVKVINPNQVQNLGDNEPDPAVRQFMDRPAPRLKVEQGDSLLTLYCTREDPASGTFKTSWAPTVDDFGDILDMAKSYGLKGDIVEFCNGIVTM